MGLRGVSASAGFWRVHEPAHTSGFIRPPPMFQMRAALQTCFISTLRATAFSFYFIAYCDFGDTAGLC